MTNPITAEQARELLDGTTPGPWYWEETHPNNACANVMAKSEGGWSIDIATLYGGTDDVPAPTMPDERWGDHPIRRADAALCAAAPDLARAVIAQADELARLHADLAKAVKALKCYADDSAYMAPSLDGEAYVLIDGVLCKGARARATLEEITHD